MFDPGDVISFYVHELGKAKYHLCISLNGFYVFVSSQRDLTYEGDLIVDCNEFPFLTPTASGQSRISCARIMEIPDATLRVKTTLKKEGVVSRKLLLDIIRFIEGNPVIPLETQEAILEGLGDWV